MRLSVLQFLKSSSKKIAMPMPTGLPSGWRLDVKESGRRVKWQIFDDEGVLKSEFSIIETNDPYTWKVSYTQSEVSGYGAFLYEKAMEWCGQHGGHLAPDTMLSDFAVPVWGKYFLRDDIEKVPYKRDIRLYKPHKPNLPNHLQDKYDPDANPKEEGDLRDEEFLQNKFRHKKYSDPEIEWQNRKKYFKSK